MSKSKRELREQRRAAERAAAAAESRRRRIRRLLGAAGLAAVLVVAGIAVSASGGAKAKPVATSGAAKLVAGIPEKDGVLGDPKAPITVTEYLDPQCPICAEASKARPPAPDRELRPHRQGQAAGAHAELHRPGLGHAPPSSPHGAEQQGKLWAFLETFYASQGTENSGYVTDDFLTDVAKAVRRRRRARRSRSPTAPSAQDALDQADAEAAGAEGRLDPELHRQDRQRQPRRSSPSASTT